MDEMIEDYETIDDVNEKLDDLSMQYFHSLEAIKTSIKNILSLHDIKFDDDLEVEDDNVFRLITSDELDSTFYLYVAIDDETVGYYVYAQIVDEEELQDIESGVEELYSFQPTSPYLLRVRHSADD